MPCILKTSKNDQPGVIVFTHNEYLFGGLKSASIHTLLKKYHGKWRYGVHIQGNCHFLKSWPDEPWLDFILWADPEVSFLSNVKDKIIPFTCVHFYPEGSENCPPKKFDLCIGSRPIESKNFEYSLTLVKNVLIKRPHTSVLFIIPDDRKTNFLSFIKGKHRNRLLEKCLDYFSASQMRQISFIASSTSSFGLFPLSSELYWHLIASSRATLLTSLSEGTPRVIIESIIHQTRPIVMDKLVSGLNEVLKLAPIVKLNQDHHDVDKIILAIEHENVSFSQEERQAFLFNQNWPKLTNRLEALFETKFDNDWLSHDLTNRMAGHIQKRNFQMMRPKDMKNWLSKTYSGILNPEEMV